MAPGGVEFVPALTGLGAPWWDPDARGTLCGLTRGANRGHIARATLDAMALQNVDILKAMEKDLGKRIKLLEKQMLDHARNLEFEKAARTRDQLALLREQAFGAPGADVVPISAAPPRRAT